METNDLLGWPERWPQEKTQPLTPEPPVAQYKVRKCLACDDFTTREMCARCQALKLAPVFGVLRERVRNGHRTDWPGEQWTHTEYQTIWQMAAPKTGGWRAIFYALIDRARWRHFGHPRLHQARPWFFHPESFRNEEAA